MHEIINPLLSFILLIGLFAVLLAASAAILRVVIRSASQLLSAAASTRMSGPPPLPMLYRKAVSLMTPTERAFHQALEAAVAGQFRIFSKVRLADVLEVTETLDRSERQKAFNAIQSKHVDFVGCDPSDMSIQFVVELDDRSHLREDRRARDELVDRAMADASIPIFRFAASRAYDVEAIRDTMFTKQ